MSYANMAGVPTQTEGVSELLASDWNTYVRDNFDSIKYGHIVVSSNALRPSAVDEGTMVFTSDTNTFWVYDGSSYVEAVNTASLLALAVTTAKIDNLAVTEGKIADDAVSAAKLKDSVSVDSDRAVTTNHIRDLAVTTGKLDASAVTSAKIADNTIVLGDLAVALQEFLVPTGSVQVYAGGSAPSGWVLCYGQELLISSYTGLYNVLTSTGTVFPFGTNTNGSGGAGTTHFRVPDLRGRVAAGLDNMGGTDAGILDLANTLGTITGTQYHILTPAETALKTHQHGFSGSTDFTDVVHSHTLTLYDRLLPQGSGSSVTYNVKNPTSAGTENRATSSTSINHQHTYSGTTGGLTEANGSPHINMQPTMLLNYIIKY